MTKVLGKVWPGFKNKYDLDIYDLRQVGSHSMLCSTYFVSP